MARGAPAARERAPRGSNFSKTEDTYICEAWVTVSTDSSVGAGQTAPEFWARIFEAFKKHHGDAPVNPSRTAKSIQTRWQRPISYDCKEMVAIRKNNPCPSGHSPDSYEDFLNGIYASRNAGDSFLYWPHLDFLTKKIPSIFGQETPLEAVPNDVREYMASLPKGASLADVEQGTAMDTRDPQGDDPRPIGVKKAKKEVYNKKNNQQQDNKRGRNDDDDPPAIKQLKTTEELVNSLGNTISSSIADAIERIGAKFTSMGNGAAFWVCPTWPST